MMGAIFLTNKPKKYVFIQLSFHLAKGNGIRLGPRLDHAQARLPPSIQFDPDLLTSFSTPRFGAHKARVAKL